MLPDGSGIESAAATPGVPTFTSTELRKQLDAVLGKGASGTVYSLRDFPGLAAKEIQLDGLDQRSIDAARLELATLPALSHPGILRYHQVIEDDSFVYIVMDRHDGTLDCLLIEHKRKKTRVSSRLICSIARQVAAALAYLSSASGVDAKGEPFRGLVHRDLKPINILVAADGEQFILADFGLCKDALRSGSTFAGSPAYMAPETFIHRKTTPASDIWALGVIVYELATLKRPNFLEGREPKDVFIDGWKPDLSPVKDDFMREILEKIFVLDPEKRLTARELHEMLNPCDVSADELGAQYMVLQHKCSSLETALNDASARIAILEGDTRTKSERIIALEEGLEAKAAKVSTLEETLAAKSDQIDAQSSKIDALEGQCKEHLAMMKALENKIALLTVNNPQSGLLLLPRLMRAAHTNSIETVRLLVKSGDGIGKRDEQGRTALMHAAQQGHVEPARLLVEKEKGLQDRNGWTALMHAVHNNHPGVVKILITCERGKRDNSRRTALMIAAERGHTEIVAALAPHEKGLTDSSGRTALMLAASNAHIEAVRVLVEHEKGARDSRNRTALMTAAQRGDLEMVKVLAEHEKGIMDEDGHTALVHAARAGHREAAELLMEHEKDVTGWTMLMCAAALGDVEMVSQHLGEKGQKDKEGRTALIIAAQNRRDEAVKFLMKHEGGASGWTSLICAAYLGDVDAVRDNLHEKGCKDVTGMTALMWAVRREHKGVVEVLLEHEKGMKDIIGRTALMLATEGENKELIEMLIPCERGLQDNSGRTALMHATVHCHTHTVELLLKHEMKIQDNEGRTALMWAIQRNRNEMIKILLEHEKGVKDKQGHNALYHALKSGHTEVAKVIIPYEDPTDWNGVTALMRAAARGDAEMVELLIPLQKGMKDKDGRTALMLAAQKGHKKAVEVLIEHEKGLKDKDGNTAFVHALRNKHEGIATLLRKHEALSWTPLMCAAVTGDVETARRHLSDKDKKNGDGETALMIAARVGRGDIVELLDPTDKNGVTALVRAAERGDVEAVRALIPLQKGRKMAWDTHINGLRILGVTALMMAAVHGHTKVVKLLVEEEGGMKDEDGRTALMSAAHNGRTDCVRLLLDKEGGMRDKNGWTALIWAAYNGHAKAVNLLAEREGGMKTTREWSGLPPGTTALDIAKKKGYKEIVSIISE